MSTRPLSRHRSASCAGILLLLSFAVPGLAEESCEEGLRTAQKSYDLGLLEAVAGQLTPCFAGRSSRSELIQAYALLAKAALAADDDADARQAVSALLRLDSAYEPGPPPRFAQLVASVRREEAAVQVASVSKSPESLREAPATVVVITGDEILRRGYTDLEQLLHDLPGFDIARGNGYIYSMLYQRGFRSNDNDRNLLLIDGVEQNNLNDNVVFLSRQYPLTNIDRIEVIYGPASTMYGANAYTGVISILTKEPAAIARPDHRFEAKVLAGSASFGTHFAELGLTGHDKSGNIAWTLTGRLFRSAEQDLSRFDDWDYRYTNADYRGRTAPIALLNCQLTPGLCTDNASPYYTITRDQKGTPISVDLTAAGEQLARELDRRLIERNQIHYSDPTDDRSFNGKLRISNLTMGLQLWSANEGNAGWVNDFYSAPNGSAWTPRHTSFYIQYSRPVGKNLALNLFSRYLATGLETGSSRTILLHNFISTQIPIQWLNPACLDGVEDPKRLECPWIEVIEYSQLSTQLKTEISLVYQPSQKLDAIAGVDLRKGSNQLSQTARYYGLARTFFLDNAKTDVVEHTDYALYAQVSRRLQPNLKLVLGGRLDVGEIGRRLDGGKGMGAVYTSRAAAVYTPTARTTLKLIYSEAFKDPTDEEKFATVLYVRDRPSGGLRPERVRNLELNAGWQIGDQLSLDASLYRARYSDVVALRDEPGCTEIQRCGQLHNLRELRVEGAQISARYRLARLDLFANATFTDPVELNPRDRAGNPLLDDRQRQIRELPVGDIARYHLNLGGNLDITQRLGLDLRLNYVGARKTGQGTTVPTNPFNKIDAYTVVNATWSYRELLPGATLQLAVDNLFDRGYFDPGVREAGFTFASRLPQPGRTFSVRLLAGIPSRQSR